MRGNCSSKIKNEISIGIVDVACSKLEFLVLAETALSSPDQLLFTFLNRDEIEKCTRDLLLTPSEIFNEDFKKALISYSVFRDVATLVVQVRILNTLPKFTLRMETRTSEGFVSSYGLIDDGV